LAGQAADARTTEAIGDCAENGFGRYATQPDAIAAVMRS
jgi:hypothetical protein